MNMAKNLVKQFEPTKVKVGEYQYLIYPFPAFRAANISGELFSLLAPIAASMVSLIPDNKSVLDAGVENAVPQISAAFGLLDGNKVERILEKLLIDQQNVVVDFENGEADYLTKELADNLFCGNAQLLYVLAYHVIRVNYEDFFGKTAALFGKQETAATGRMKFQNMAASMFPDSMN